MLGHPDVTRYLLDSRRAALLREARDGRLARLAHVDSGGESWPRRWFRRLFDALRRTEPTFACTEPGCLPAASK